MIVGITVDNNLAPAPDAALKPRQSFVDKLKLQKQAASVRKANRQRVVRILTTNADADFREIAAKCNCSYSYVYTVYWRLYPERPRPLTKRRLLIQRYAAEHPSATCQDIATALDYTYDQVYSVLHPHQKPNPHAKLSKKVCAYADAHPWIPVIKIAKRFKLKPDFTAKLIKLRNSLSPHPNNYIVKDRFRNLRNPDSPRVKLIQQAIRERWILDELAAKLKLTRERARQLIKNYLEMYPESAPPAVYRVGTTSQKLGTTEYYLEQLSAEHSVGKRCGKRGWMYTDDDIVKLRELIEKHSTRECCICKSRFTVKSRRKPSSTCGSNRCRVRLYRYTPVGTRSCHMWGPLVALLDPIKDKPTVYIPYRAAISISGLSPMQLVLLRSRKTIRTIPAPSGRIINGTPVSVYALEDIKVVRDYLLTTRYGLLGSSDASEPSRTSEAV